MLLFIFGLFISINDSLAGDHPLAADIAAGFSKWQTTTPRTALYYAEVLAQGNDADQKKAQAIIFHGAGFGGFAKNRTATPDEMKQYYSTINLIKGIIPNASELGKSGRADVTYHQDVMRLLSLSATGSLVESAPLYQENGVMLTGAFYWLGQYHMHVNSAMRAFNDFLLKNYAPYREKSVCCYANADYPYYALPHVHSYNSVVRSYDFKSNPGNYLNIVELDASRNEPIFFRPHGHVGACTQTPAGSSWQGTIKASILWRDGSTTDFNDSVSIHDNVASPNAVTNLGTLDDLNLKGPFVSSIQDDYSVKTLHVVVDRDKQTRLLDVSDGHAKPAKKDLTTVELLGYLVYVTDPLQFEFVKEQLKCMAV